MMTCADKLHCDAHCKLAALIFARNCNGARGALVRLAALAPMRLVYLDLTCLFLLCYIPYVVPQDDVQVASAAQLAQAIHSGASTVVLQSRITGLPDEALSESILPTLGDVNGRYDAAFPLVRVRLVQTRSYYCCTQICTTQALRIHLHVNSLMADPHFR